MSARVRLGLIGCGDIAVAQHLPAILRSDEVALAALCDISEARVRPLAQQLGVPWFTDASCMLASLPMAAVIIATPPWVTPGLTIQALRAGLYVLCEKPMALTMEAAEAVALAERASEGCVQVGFTYRHDPLLAQVRNWIDQGILGRPLMIRMGAFDEVWDVAGNPEHYARLFATLEHGSPSMHDGAHSADYLYFLTGSSVRQVSAFGFQSRPEFPCSNYDISVIQFENGDAAKLEVGWFYPVLPCGQFEVLGPAGFAKYDWLGRRAELITAEAHQCVRDDENWWNLCFKRQLQAFVCSVREHGACMPGCTEGIYSLDLCKRIEQSMSTKRSV